MRVAEPTVERLVQYYRLLRRFHEEGRKVVSSKDIGEHLLLKASQVRKDLSCFGEIGKRGVGYHVDRLYEHIRGILASPSVRRMALVGVGNLGAALVGYNALRSDKFSLDALFDVDPRKVGTEIGGILCHHVDEMPRILRDRSIEILLLAVPGRAAQECLDKAAESGTLKGVLSFSPVPLVAPAGVLVFGVDISVELEKLLFYLKHGGGSRAGEDMIQ